MSRIYVTQTDPDDPYAPTVRAGYFSEKSAIYWHGGKEVFDGANLADCNTRDQNSGQGLYRTAQGRWVLRYWSNWQGSVDQYAYTSPEDAREWLLFNDYDDAVREHFGEIAEEQGPAGASPNKPTELADVAIKYIRAVADRSLTWEPEKHEVTEAVNTVQAELRAALARLAELEAIEDRAQRVITHIPDPDWVKCARFILDGKSGPLANT